jgi:hypothetical protein
MLVMRGIDEVKTEYGDRCEGDRGGYVILFGSVSRVEGSPGDPRGRGRKQAIYWWARRNVSKERHYSWDECCGCVAG